MEYVILVNELDEQIGTAEKLEAHQKGLLHRAFSVFLFNEKNEILLQRRSMNKYHSGGLWTNTCCSHPRENESVEDAAHRRLMEEMGISAKMRREFSFIYKAELDSGLTEHELDHVLIGQFNEEPKCNPEEVADWKFQSMAEIEKDIQANPELFTEWFKIIFNEVHQRINSHESV